MGIPSAMREIWIEGRKRDDPRLLIASPLEDNKIREAKECSEESVRAGAKAAAITCVLTAVPTLIGCQKIPWAKANLNHTAQALIISGASIAAYFITADKAILEHQRRKADYKYKRTA